ncbi:glycerophosphotransferase [Nocardiopsis sp. MG754419]|uniref:glycerophosphotransferase n=1 Tax=Nocardiopsis sp. MG754419 TaxID=2259865 RepID=UPI001BAD714D|nr:glycerophosphotransferase [Nocardiopsis sp. MG754419]MBR8743604.1 glycerophosphotransferase [Nocardiopsis sp. MG754419]
MSLPDTRKRATLIGTALLGTTYLLMLVGVATGQWWIFLVGIVGGYAMDALLLHRMTAFAKSLQQVRLGITPRTLLRQLLALGLLITTAEATSTGIGLILLTFLVLFGLQLLCGVVGRRLRTRRRLPIATRNIPLESLHIPDSPPMPFVREPMSRLLPLDIFLVLGAIGYVVFGALWAAVAGAVITTLVTVVALVVFLWHLRRARAIPHEQEVMDFTQEWLTSYRPEVVLYFSGSSDSAYQVDMWLETLDRMPRRSIIVLRERTIAAQLAPTRVPVLCVPSATNLMALDFDPARVALYPANTGKNIHMLRNPRLKHVFIGHGDSDKIASVNPFSKVYDEVWTAGRAGRDRYARARVGVREDEIVEVGRPQLDEIRTDTAPNSVRTVLYAPTWEGWTDDPGNTSLIEAGPTLIAKLLDGDLKVRVLYKPHPFTGIRSAAARAAHKRIVALLGGANQGTKRREDRERRLAELEKRLAAFDNDTGARDEAHYSREEGRALPETIAEMKALSTEWHRVYWDGHADDEHLVVQGPRPTLYSCFNQADLLISDISSVVADFVATEKPYAITNCEGITHAEFQDRHPTSSAAYMLSPDGEGLDAALDAVHLAEADRLASERTELRSYLLGGPESQSRFNAAVDDLYERGSLLHPLSPWGLPDTDPLAPHLS